MALEVPNETITDIKLCSFFVVSYKYNRKIDK